MTGTYREPAEVRIAAGAERDLADIYRRRLAQRGPEGRDGAEALLARLVASIESLARHPLKGPVPPELEVLGIHDFRQVSVRPFRIIYLPESEPARVTVTIIADSRRDFRTLLEDRLLRPVPPA